MHASHDQRFVSAPVFGRPDAAVSAKLFVAAAGDPADLLRIREPLANISQRVFQVGEKPSSANLLKLCGNFMILAAIESLGEAMTLAERGGITKRQLLEVLTATLFDAPVYRNYGAILIEQRFRPAGFAASLGLKDMRLVAAAADAARVSMPVLSVLERHLRETIAREGAGIDWSAITKTIAKESGV